MSSRYIHLPTIVGQAYSSPSPSPGPIYTFRPDSRPPSNMITTHSIPLEALKFRHAFITAYLSKGVLIPHLDCLISEYDSLVKDSLCNYFYSFHYREKVVPFFPFVSDALGLISNKILSREGE